VNFRVVVALVAPIIVLPLIAYALIRHGREGESTSNARVTYGQVQALFTSAGCAGCHPGVNSELNLQPGASYASLANQTALEDPHYAYIVAGDPEKSFLYLKVAGFGKAGQVGGRMPFGRKPLPASQVALLANWIEQGARGPGGALPPKSTTPLPGEPDQPALSAATSPSGTGTISGTVIDQARRPIAGALVTLLLRGPSQPGGEEHYRVAETNGAGEYTLPDVPTGMFELKAYAPHTIYTSHFVSLKPGASAHIDFGLATRVLTTPEISNPAVTLVPGGGETLSMTVTGPNLDPNYTLVANPGAGRVFEVHAPGAKQGVWKRTLPFRLKGPWIFFAVDRICSSSAFLKVRG
jgi:hypothetical protein